MTNNIISFKLCKFLHLVDLFEYIKAQTDLINQNNILSNHQINRYNLLLASEKNGGGWVTWVVGAILTFASPLLSSKQKPRWSKQAHHSFFFEASRSHGLIFFLLSFRRPLPYLFLGHCSCSPQKKVSPPPPPPPLMGCDVCHVSILQGQKWILLARIHLSKWRSDDLS